MKHSAKETTFTTAADIVISTKKTVWGRHEKVCQTCRHHKNRPSFCRKNNEFVGRKDAACEKYSM